MSPTTSVEVKSELDIDIAFGDYREVTALQAVRDINERARETIRFLWGRL